MRLMNTSTELQIRFRPDEVEAFVNFVLSAEPTRFRKDLVEHMRRECLL